MSALGELTRPVENEELHDKLSTMAISHLTQNGDTNVAVSDIEHDVTASSEKATVYTMAFSADAGTATLQITFFANGTHQIYER